jgi:hypothetical protein
VNVPRSPESGPDSWNVISIGATKEEVCTSRRRTKLFFDKLWRQSRKIIIKSEFSRTWRLYFLKWKLMIIHHISYFGDTLGTECATPTFNENEGNETKKQMWCVWIADNEPKFNLLYLVL